MTDIAGTIAPLSLVVDRISHGSLVRRSTSETEFLGAETRVRVRIYVNYGQAPARGFTPISAFTIPSRPFPALSLDARFASVSLISLFPGR